VRTVQIAVGNGRYYGGGMTVADDATINDQRLDLYSLEVQNAWQIVRLLPAMLKGKQAEWSEVRSLQGQEIEVSTLKPLPINTDGEITTYTPAKFRLIPEAISVLVPQSPLRTP
jgi:diacylglycerol kinase family enzyme